jgi:hypothetical protein
MKMEAAESSETSVNIYRKIQPHLTQYLKTGKPRILPDSSFMTAFPLRRDAINFGIRGREQRE